MKPLGILLLAFLSTVPLPVSALVNMKDASFSKTWTDFTVTGATSNFHIRRTYDSRSIERGLFGFGWCSDIETRLKFTYDGHIKIKECSLAGEIIYVPATADMEPSDERIPKRTLSAHSPATYFTALNRPGEHIRRLGDTLIRTQVDGTNQVFNKDGRLLRVKTQDQKIFNFYYDQQGRPLEIRNSPGENKLLFFYKDGTNFVRTISGTGDQRVDYEYQDDNLIRTVGSQRGLIKYSYDQFHNLTQINYPNNSSELLIYDSQKDWVTEYRGRDGCVETYHYLLHQQTKGMQHSSSVMKRVCGRLQQNLIHYEFWHEAKDNNGTFLSRMKIHYKNETLEIRYHPKHGQPVFTQLKRRD